MSDMGEEGAFYNAEIEITPELVGRCSPYHSPSGVHAVAALIARAIADPMAQSDALAGFLEAARRPAAGLDLTLGRTSTLLGAAILLDAVPAGGLVDSAPLRQFGDASLAGLWRDLDAKPAIAEADISYPGIAHGWAGFLYATLQWCRVSHAAIPTGMERRLVELEALALPAGRGLDWPWMLHHAGEPPTMAGWCNGSCGFVYLWTLANRLLGESRYLDLALGAAWRSWDAPELTTSLCCGLAGRAYALLNIYRATGEKVWLDRARDLGVRAATKGQTPSEYPHSLYKGGFGLAVLAADLEQPEDARMPFFEPIGYLD
jgi:serine/threonine-protein kinase